MFSRPVSEAISFLKNKVNLQKILGLNEIIEGVKECAIHEKAKQERKKKDLKRWIAKKFDDLKNLIDVRKKELIDNISFV